MNNKMLKGLVEAGAIKAVSIIANGSLGGNICELSTIGEMTMEVVNT
jgi:hypothetical protein